MRITWFGIQRKPCDEMVAMFVYGPKFCGTLTRRRWREGWKLKPICDPCHYMHTEYNIVPAIREVSVHEPIDHDTKASMNYVEVELSNCEFGCKIYENKVTGERVLAHNSTYGCKK